MKLNAYILALYSSDMSQSISRDDSTIVDLAEAGQRTLKLEQATRFGSARATESSITGKCSRHTGTTTDHRRSDRPTHRGGWVVDKGDVTDVIDAWDHRFLVESDPLVDAFEASGDSDALVVLDHPPTAEVMSVLLEQRMLDAFPDTVSDVSVSVSETGELCASY